MQSQQKNSNGLGSPRDQQQQQQRTQQVSQHYSGSLLSQIGSSKNWIEKFFVLQDGVLLGYPLRDRQRQRRPELHIPMQDAFVRLSQDLYPTYFCFQVVTTREVCSFIAQTQQELVRWTQLMAGCSRVIQENLVIEQLDRQIRAAESRTTTSTLSPFASSSLARPASTSVPSSSSDGPSGANMTMMLTSDTIMRRRYIASLRINTTTAPLGDPLYQTQAHNIQHSAATANDFLSSPLSHLGTSSSSDSPSSSSSEERQPQQDGSNQAGPEAQVIEASSVVAAEEDETEKEGINNDDDELEEAVLIEIENLADQHDSDDTLLIPSAMLADVLSFTQPLDTAQPIV